ncbi:hypothetical protein B0181_08195 [Moraxella caviae]|uniref:Homoserine/homoserine lactone efflux protein n=1 Tax=Moraxella caviae TaxID=34060 RepID=A0A1S9ZYI0_9GAMM|nr:LysE family translocator [Moraxella caviae]OOR88520.1 hypothetical protein B0181_08195 [Moraxella caviae]STZ14933.1 Homoserine/homoserine lactone efflux protein [Moraxella caviae]VEW12701.1 Homoserine/homoserine lactone efflux protein [Moraxella caviae]
MNYPLIFAYITTIVLFLGTPGPVTVMVANTASRHGFVAGFLTVAGTNAASLALIGTSFLVIQGLFALSETWLLYLTLFGLLYLAYFAVQILKDSIDLNALKAQDTPKPAAKHAIAHFKNGFLVGISNPKDVLFFIAFFPAFLGVADSLTLAMLILVVIWVILDYGILSLYSYAFSKMTNAKLVNAASKLSGVILLLVAVYGVYKTVLELMGGLS